MSHTKLYEILAVEAGLEKAANKLVLESKKTFGKENLFQGSVRELKMFADVDEQLNTSETLKLETTVAENINYVFEALAQHWDSVVQKDLANQSAIADVVINGEVIIGAVPATTLLGLETKLAEVRKLLEAVPTLQPGIEWIPDESIGNDVFRAEQPIIQFRTEKDIEFKTASEPTKEHPAQVVQLNITKNVGKYTTTKWSGMVSSKRKSDMLKRLEILLRAVKQARQRANAALVEDKHIGKDLLDFIIK